jgi:Flp pilus assembly protein TadD
MGLMAAAYLVQGRPETGPDSDANTSAGSQRRQLPGPARLAVRGAISIAIAVAAVAIARPVLGEYYRSQGAVTLASDPVGALAKANDSLALNSNSMETYYLKAAAYARLGDYAHARGALWQAAGLETHNFVPWALLGDLAVRRGDMRSARRSYDHAWRLNPRDATLERLRHSAR